MLVNQNQAYSCLCPRIKHTHAYESKPSILILVSQNRYLPTTTADQNGNLCLSELLSKLLVILTAKPIDY